MATDRVHDIHAFRVFLDEQLANGGALLTPARARELWEIQNASEDEENEAVEAIRRGFADIKAGRVRPARQALAELRRKHTLPERSSASASRTPVQFAPIKLTRTLPS